MQKQALVLTAAAGILAGSVCAALAQQTPGGPMMQQPSPQMMQRPTHNMMQQQQEKLQERQLQGGQVPPRETENESDPDGAFHNRRHHTRAMGGGMMGMGGGPGLRIIFSLMDPDADGTVSLEEFKAAQERIFKAMDANKDGLLTFEEMQEFLRGQRPAPRQ